MVALLQFQMRSTWFISCRHSSMQSEMQLQSFPILSPALCCTCVKSAFALIVLVVSIIAFIQRVCYKKDTVHCNAKCLRALSVELGGRCVRLMCGQVDNCFLFLGNPSKAFNLRDTTSRRSYSYFYFRSAAPI